jgi:chemotaxis protein MotB
VIDKIGPLLAKRHGVIIVRGHTDNRPYHSETYDNWRLSTARAQMAYYMLIRSGVDAQRIEHVEGYADRRPKLPNDPAAAQNRRIEILIRETRP